MAEGRRGEAWSVASSLMALLANCHRDSKRKASAYRPDDFDPTRERRPRGARITADRVHLLKRFVKNQPNVIS